MESAFAAGSACAARRGLVPVLCREMVLLRWAGFMEPAAVPWGEGEGENPLAMCQRRKTWFATVRLEIWELKSWEPRGSWESQSSCKRGFVTCKEQKPLPLCDPTASAPPALAQVMPSVPTHTLGGPYTPHCMAMLPKGTQCSIAGHVPPLLCGLCWSLPGAGWCRQGRGCRQEPAVSPSAAGAGLCQGVRR